MSKRHTFLTMVVGVVAQHLVFFRQGAALLGRMEGPYSDAMAIVEHLRKEGQAKQVCARGLCAPALWVVGGVRERAGGVPDAVCPCGGEVEGVWMIRTASTLL